MRKGIDGNRLRAQASFMLFDHFIRASCVSAAVLFAALHSPASVAATFRCVSSDSRVVYQDKSCPPGAQGAAIEDTPNSGARFARERDIRRLSRSPAPERVERAPRLRSTTKARIRPKTDASERRFISPGTSVAEVRRKIGPPDEVVRLSVTGGGKKPKKDSRRRWVYGPVDSDPQTTTILTVKDGRVLHVERNVTY